MIQDQCSITSVHIGNGFRARQWDREDLFFLKDCGNIGVASSDMMLSGCQMAINEAYRGILHAYASDDCSLQVDLSKM